MTSEEQMAVMKKNPITVACGVLSLLLAVGIYFRSGAIPEAEAELAQKSGESEKLALNITNSAQLKEQLDDLVTANKALDAGIIRASQQGANSQFFYKLESDTGVKMVDFRQTTANVTKPAKGNFAPVAFTVSVQGTFQQIVQYLRHLENGAHFTRVMTASISGNASQRNSPLTLSLTLELLGLP